MFHEGGDGKRVVVVAVSKKVLKDELVGIAGVDVLDDFLDGVVVHLVVRFSELLVGLGGARPCEVLLGVVGKTGCFTSESMDNLVESILLPFASHGFIAFACCVLLEAFGCFVRCRSLFSCLYVVRYTAYLNVGFAVPAHGFDVPHVVRGGIADASFDASGNGSP